MTANAPLPDPGQPLVLRGATVLTMNDAHDLLEDADVLVVGAGLTGLCTAVLLARAGHPPVVVDARAAGAGTTGHSTAKLSLLQGSVLQRLHEHAGAAVVSAYVRANRAGQLGLLFSRYFKTKTRDVSGTAIMLLQAPIIGALLAVVFGGQRKMVPFWCLGALQDLSRRTGKAGNFDQRRF